MAETDGEKTQDATPHRRQQAREEGQVAKSQDFASAALLLVGLAAFIWLGGPLVEMLASYTADQLGGEPWLTIDPQSFVAHEQRMVYALAYCLLPIFGALMFTGIAVNVFQSGFLFLPEKLAPDLTRLDPLQGLARLFSLASLVRLVMGLLKMTLVASVAYVCLRGQQDGVLGLAAMSTPEIARFLAEILLWTSLKIAVALLLLAVLDYGFQWWKQEARPADDDAGGPRGAEEPRGQSADGRAAEAGAAATGAAPHFLGGAQGRRCDHQPHGVGRGHPLRSRRRWPRRSWWPRGPA